jgi:hypothetical protein
VSNSPLEYWHTERERRGDEGNLWGGISLAIGVGIGALAIACPLNVLEGLTMMFYFYAIVFFTGAVLGAVGVFRDSRRRFAVLGLLVNLAAMGWKCGTLYAQIKYDASQGWMTMPWPFN